MVAKHEECYIVGINMGLNNMHLSGHVSLNDNASKFQPFFLHPSPV